MSTENEEWQCIKGILYSSECPFICRRKPGQAHSKGKICIQTESNA